MLEMNGNRCPGSTASGVRIGKMFCWYQAQPRTSSQQFLPSGTWIRWSRPSDRTTVELGLVRKRLDPFPFLREQCGDRRIHRQAPAPASMRRAPPAS